MAISLKTHKMLWARSGNRCALSTCRRELVEGESETDDASVVGDEAHIVAREKKGPRGDSPLPLKERDKYDNLILMCKVHHKQIDDQPKKYTVEVLHKMKETHLNWVKDNLTIDKSKEKDEEIYAGYIDKWVELSGLDNWQNWTSHIFGSGQPTISIERYEKLQQLNEYLLSRIWPKRYSEIEFGFTNFRIILSDFLRVFSIYMKESGSKEDRIYTTDRFYRIKEHAPERYHSLLELFDFHVELVEDLCCELTRGANYLCDQIRRDITITFRIKEGILLITSGPDMNFDWTTARLEFETNDTNVIKYPGLRKFMETRQDRGYHFGTGVNEYCIR